MSLANAQQMLCQAESQTAYFRGEIERIAETLPDDKARQLKYLLDYALFWQESVTNWKHRVEFWAAKEAVYPPPQV